MFAPFISGKIGLAKMFILGFMNTAISLPGNLFVLAEKYASEHGLNRSELYAVALREYIVAHLHDGLTQRISQVCAELDSALPTDLAQVGRKSLLESEW